MQTIAAIVMLAVVLVFVGIAYRPASGYTGTDGFSYMIYDGELATTAHVTLNVIATVPTTNGSINWSGSGTPANSLTNLSLPPHEEWIANFLGATQEQRSLADMTGLAVTMNP